MREDPELAEKLRCEKHVGEAMRIMNWGSSDFVRGVLWSETLRASQPRGGYVKDMNQNSAAEEIQRRCFAEMARDSNLTYGDAFQRVTAADRNLAEQYLFEARDPT